MDIVGKNINLKSKEIDKKGKDMENDSVANKLKNYLDDNGIRLSWFAEKIGISVGTLSKFLKGKGKLPKKCWKKVVVVTKGKISMKELVSEFLIDTQEFEDDDKD
jgi:predicted transcriptional regulator